MLNRVKNNMLAYDDLQRLYVNEKKISVSYLNRQATIIYYLKNYMKILRFLEGIRADIGLDNSVQRKKINEYKKLVDRLEDNFFDIMREIAFTILFEEEYYSKKYIKNGLTWNQLQQIKIWMQVEGQKVNYKNRAQEQEMYIKKLNKSIRNVYRSFL